MGHLNYNIGGDDSSHDGKKKDMGKFKCFTRQNTRNYVIQYPGRKKGKKKTQVATSTQVEEFVAMFEKEFSLASFLSGTRVRGVQLDDNDAKLWIVVHIDI